MEDEKRIELIREVLDKDYLTAKEMIEDIEMIVGKISFN